jgi:hypothetical protein
MAGEGGGAARAGPFAAVAELTAAAEAERSAPRPAAAHARWIRPIADYERRETSEVHGTRYG